MNAWLLSPYRTDSHAYWADWLTGTFRHIEWHKLELPGRHFRWRIRGNPLSWLTQLPDNRPDLIVATSMVDLATLKGLHPRLATVPALYYFHENQFAYPAGEHQVRSIEPQMVQLYGALAAERCVFNSRYNLESFLHGVDALLGNMPDAVPDNVSNLIRGKASVLPVPVKPVAPGQKNNKLILWNHRWEYDKQPGLFAGAMIQLHESGVEFELALLGARPAVAPAALQQLRDIMPQRIVYDGKVDAKTYRRILGESHIVVSTSRHEFQGLAIMEAVSAGATPLLPDSLCYPEYYASQYLYPDGDVNALASTLCDWLQRAAPEPPDITPWLQSSLQPAWGELLHG